MRRSGDLAGVRVTTYVEEDRERVIERIKANFTGPGPGVEVDTKDKHCKSRFYRATHCQVAIKEDELVGEYANLNGLTCEVQVCSLLMLAYVFNEIEHDLAYKPLTGDLCKEARGFLDVLGQLTDMGDVVIVNLLSAVNKGKRDREEQFNDQHDFVAMMRELSDNPASFPRNSGQLFAELKVLGLDSVATITKDLLVNGTDYRSRSRTLLERLKRYVEVDADSSDCLLVLLLDKHVKEVLANHKVGRGRGRPPRIYSVARGFQTMQSEQRRLPIPPE